MVQLAMDLPIGDPCKLLAKDVKGRKAATEEAERKRIECEKAKELQRIEAMRKDRAKWLPLVSEEDRAYWNSREGEGWTIPCTGDTGSKRFDNKKCHNCLCAGGGDAYPYCMCDDYARAVKAYRKSVKGRKGGGNAKA